MPIFDAANMCVIVVVVWCSRCEATRALFRLALAISRKIYPYSTWSLISAADTCKSSDCPAIVLLIHYKECLLAAVLL